MNTRNQRLYAIAVITVMVLALNTAPAKGAKILFREDFENGNADGWDLTTGGSDAAVENDGSGNLALAITRTQSTDSETGLRGMVAVTPLLDLSNTPYVTFSFDITANEGENSARRDNVDFFDDGEWTTLSTYNHTAEYVGKRWTLQVNGADWGFTFDTGNKFRFIPAVQTEDTESKQYYDNVEVLVIPEPASLALLSLGGSLGLLVRRRRG